MRHNSISTTTPHREALAQLGASRHLQRGSYAEGGIPLEALEEGKILGGDQGPTFSPLSSSPLLAVPPGVRSSRRPSSAPSSPRVRSPAPVPSPLQGEARKELRFIEEPRVVELDDTHYPLPEQAKDYPRSPLRTLPPPLLFDQHRLVAILSAESPFPCF